MKIKGDNDLESGQKDTIMELYKSFLLFDYINLSRDLMQNISFFEAGLLPPTEIPDLMRCNLNGRNVFNVDKFLKLYKMIQADI